MVTPLPGGPADAAGVRAGDSIVSIDGKPTQGLSLYEASDLLLGEMWAAAHKQGCCNVNCTMRGHWTCTAAHAAVLAGEVGSEVQLTVRHAGKQATDTLTLTRCGPVVALAHQLTVAATCRTVL